MEIWFQIIVGFISIGAYVFCDYIITRWAELRETDGTLNWRLWAAIVLAPLGIICFGLVGAKMGLAAVSTYVNTGIVVGSVLVGVVLRGETLTAYQKTGLVLGFVAMLLINLGKSPGEPPVVP